MKILLEEWQRFLNEEEKVFTYTGNADELIGHAEKHGWEFIEDDYVDAEGYVDWDPAMEDAAEFLKSQGWRIDYN